MKIVYFIDHLRRDGSQVALHRLVKGLAQKGYYQAIVCLNDSHDRKLVYDLREIGIDLRIVGRTSLISGYFLISTFDWLRQNRFDVAITWLFFSDVIGRSLARAAKIPWIVSTIRARNVHYSFWQRLLVRRTIQWADAIVINSDSEREFAISQEGAPPDRILKIPNGIEVEDFNVPNDGNALRTELGLPIEAFVIGSVGRLTRQKGYDLLIEALSTVPIDNFQLVLIGQGEEERNLRRQASGLDLAERVHFLGFRGDVPRLLGGLDLYVQPSRYEGMPNALLEAMATGLPILACSVDGICELIEDGIDGWLVLPENAKALSDAIQGIFRDKLEARRRGRAAKERIRKGFDIYATINTWEQVLTAKD